MSVELLKDFFLWSMIINFGLMFFPFFALLFLRDFVVGIHSKLFKVPEKTVSTALYTSMIFYKILIIVFNAIPYIVLRIIA